MCDVGSHLCVLQECVWILRIVGGQQDYIFRARRLYRRARIVFACFVFVLPLKGSPSHMYAAAVHVALPLLAHTRDDLGCAVRVRESFVEPL